MLPPTQHYLVSIRLLRKISFVTSFTIFKWLKKYFFYPCNILSIGYWLNDLPIIPPFTETIYNIRIIMLKIINVFIIIIQSNLFN